VKKLLGVTVSLKKKRE